MLFNTIHQLVHALRRLHGEGFLKARVCRELYIEVSKGYILKILVNFIIKLSISVEIVFKVSHSLIDIESKKSKGLKTRLQVTNLALNALVSSL